VVRRPARGRVQAQFFSGSGDQDQSAITSLPPSPTRQLSTSNGQPTNHISETAMGDSGLNRLARALGLGSGSGSAAADKTSSSSLPFKKKDVPSLAQYIQSDACGKIHLMVSLILNLGFFEPDFCAKAWCRCGVRRRGWPVIGL
jgi:hypothetical protein